MDSVVYKIQDFLWTEKMLKFDRFFTSEQLKPIFKIGQRVLPATVKFHSNAKSHINTPSKISTPRIDKFRLSYVPVNFFHTSFAAGKKVEDDVEEHDKKKSLMYYSEFDRSRTKDKRGFKEVVLVYKKNIRQRASHVDFIKAALKYMKEFGVHRDLESYKNLLDILPKGVYICKNKFMADGMYFPRQQFVAMELMEQMSSNGFQSFYLLSVAPDVEMGLMIKNIFGEKSKPYKYFGGTLYWTTKWKNKSPFLLPRPLPTDPVLLAKIAIERITSVDLQTEVSILQADVIPECIDKTWIVSGQSPKQKELLQNHPRGNPVIVEGGDVVFLKDKCISYFVLKGDGGPLPFNPPEDIDDISNIKSKYFNPKHVIKDAGPSVHEQDDGIIYAVCATGTSSKDSLLSWIRILEKTGNPVLSDVPVLFRLRQPEKLPAVSTEELVQTENKQI